MLFEFYFLLYLGCNEKEKRYKWSIRESEDITKDREVFAKYLKNALDQRLSNFQKDETLAILKIFDAQTLVKLQCREVSAGKIHYDIPEGEIEDYGIRKCEQLLSVIAEMKHIQGSGFSFDHRMAHKYLSRMKKALHAGIWEQLCPDWFVCTDDSKTLKFDERYIIKKFTANIRKENQLDRHFIIENSKVPRTCKTIRGFLLSTFLLQ